MAKSKNMLAGAQLQLFEGSGSGGSVGKRLEGWNCNDGGGI